MDSYTAERFASAVAGIRDDMLRGLAAGHWEYLVFDLDVWEVADQADWLVRQAFGAGEISWRQVVLYTTDSAIG